MAYNIKKLGQHEDFDELLTIAGREFKVRPEIIYKDYWASSALRAIASDIDISDKIIFKGGTSLSKGWNLIDRFSEDLDILITGPKFLPGISKKQAEQVFKKIHKTVEEKTALKLPNKDKEYYLRGDYFCNLWFPLPGDSPSIPEGIKETVFLEMGSRGTSNPHSSVLVNSLLGSFIENQSIDMKSQLSEYQDDWRSFEMELLNPERTFLEKLLCLHSATLKGDLNKKSRHFYDIYCIYSKLPEIKDFLGGVTFCEILNEAAQIDQQHFGGDSILDKATLARSPLFELNQDNIKLVENAYKAEKELYFKGQPAFEELINVLLQIQECLERTCMIAQC